VFNDAPPCSPVTGHANDVGAGKLAACRVFVRCPPDRRIINGDLLAPLCSCKRRCPALGDSVDVAVSQRGLVRGWDNGVTGARARGSPTSAGKALMPHISLRAATDAVAAESAETGYSRQQRW